MIEMFRVPSRREIFALTNDLSETCSSEQLKMMIGDKCDMILVTRAPTSTLAFLMAATKMGAPRVRFNKGQVDGVFQMISACFFTDFDMLVIIIVIT